MWRRAYRSVVADSPELRPFVRFVLERARAREDVDLVLPRADGMALDVVPGIGGPFRLDLEELHRSTLDADPGRRSRAVDARLDAALRPLDPWPWERARGQLTLLIRASSTLSHPDLLTWPVGLGLRAAVAIDDGESLIVVSRARCAGWGLSAEGLRDAVALAPPPLEPWDPTDPRGLRHGRPDGAALEGVCAIPHSGLLLIVDPADPAALLRLADTAAREYASGPRPVSPAVYLAESGWLEPLRVEPGHPAFEALERSRVQAWADEVAAQAEELGIAMTPLGVRQDDGRLALGVRAGDARALPEAEIYVDCEAPAGAPIEGTWPLWISSR